MCMALDSWIPYLHLCELLYTCSSLWMREPLYPLGAYLYDLWIGSVMQSRDCSSHVAHSSDMKDYLFLMGIDDQLASNSLRYRYRNLRAHRTSLFACQMFSKSDGGVSDDLGWEGKKCA